MFDDFVEAIKAIHDDATKTNDDDDDYREKLDIYFDKIQKQIAVMMQRITDNKQ